MVRTIVSPCTNRDHSGEAVTSICFTPVYADPTRPRCGPRMSPTLSVHCSFANTTPKAICERPANDLVAWISRVDALITGPLNFMRCERSSGVPAPAFGSGRRQQLPPLVITGGEVDQIVETLNRAIAVMPAATMR